MNLAQSRPDAHLQRLATAPVYAYLQDRGGWCVSNAGVFIGDDSVTLLDCTATEASARQLHEQIRAHTPLPVTQIVLTHHHGDHHGGAGIFAPATVIAHEQTRNAILRDDLDLRAIWPQTQWGTLPLIPPNATVTDRMTLHVGQLHIELLHFGPAHTTGDIVAWLPDEGILFAGDLVFSGSAPFAFMGSIQGSIRALEHLRALEPAVVVSGHGPLASAEIIDENADYLRWVQSLAVDGVAAGLSPLETARRADLGPYRQLTEPERLVGNLHRAYVEHDNAVLGMELPTHPTLADMITFNQGPLPCGA
ncbi:MBL fold metallo-hydrolase [Streptomyces spectabilis]|uniref:MBL fold metallo-hydrolase n=1 Tax=Streptomyces spectabilis TaxID=68270 RepID=UPI0033DE9E92